MKNTKLLLALLVASCSRPPDGTPVYDGGALVQFGTTQPASERRLVAEDELSATYEVYWWRKHANGYGDWIRCGPEIQTVRKEREPVEKPR